MKKVLVVIALIQLAIVIWLFMALLDSALLIDTQNNTIYKLNQEKAIAKKALKACWVGLTENEVERFVRTLDQNRESYKRDRNLIEVSEMIFFMEDGRVNSVGFHDLETKFGSDERADQRNNAGTHGLGDAGLSR